MYFKKYFSLQSIRGHSSNALQKKKNHSEFPYLHWIAFDIKEGTNINVNSTKVPIAINSTID